MTTGTKYCEHYREGLPHCVECETESTRAHDKACVLLAESRAEIERKDKLIEQMREALRFVYRFKVGLSFNETPDGIEASRVICAALEATKRGE